MAYTQWSDDLNTGIKEIDDQHRQLVDYLNQLYDVIVKNNRDGIVLIFEQIIDYTQFHFTFEESIMKENDYEYYIPHKHIHDLFIKRVLHYKERFEHGENIAEELHALLKRWLINHIAHDDKNFAVAKKAKDEEKIQTSSGFFSRLFGIR